MKGFFNRKTLTGVVSVVVLFSFVIPSLATGETDSYELSGDGEVIYFNADDVISIIIPTDAALNFFLDPLGLSDLEDGGPGKSLEELRMGPKAGSVDFHNYTPVVINQSNIDILVNFDVQITGDADVVGTLDDILKEDEEDPWLYIAMTVSKDSVNDTAANADNFIGTLQLVLSDDSQKVQFVLDKAVYTLDASLTYELKEGSGHGTQLLFDGVCNPYGNWMNFVTGGPSKVGINAVFSFAEPTGNEEFVDKDLAYGLVKSDNLTWQDKPDDGGDDDKKLGFTGTEDPRRITVGPVTRGTTVSIPFEFGDTEYFNAYNYSGFRLITNGGITKKPPVIEINTIFWTRGNWNFAIFLQVGNLRDYYLINLIIE